MRVRRDLIVADVFEIEVEINVVFLCGFMVW